jgi:8-hydroxy-5-deazaflavin:NADPH oxidoreductase
MTSIGVIGSGHIGGNIARRLALAGHSITVSFARDQDKLAVLARHIGARVGEPAEAAAAEVVVLSVPWSAVGEALAAAGNLGGRIVIDTTNQFGANVAAELGGHTAARFNADRISNSKYAKCFNTLTSAFQVEAAERKADERVVQWIASDDVDAQTVVAELVSDAGYVPVLLSGIDDCQMMEAPRRPGAIYGEEYRARDALVVVEAVRTGRPIPPPPSY